MADSMNYENSTTNASLARLEHSDVHSDVVRKEEAHVDSELSLGRDEYGTTDFLPGLDPSDDAPNEEVSAGTGRSSKHGEDGMNGSSIEGGNDNAGYLRGLAAEVVNQEDLERSVARQVCLHLDGMLTTAMLKVLPNRRNRHSQTKPLSEIESVLRRPMPISRTFQTFYLVFDIAK